MQFNCQIILEDHLKALFGYNTFRDAQKEIVTAIMEGKDVLAILPTGAGKSICYQLPALLLPGIALVVSPLISLMQDQVVSLSKNGLSAAFLNSSLHHEEIQDILRNLSKYKMLYVAPERFADPHFIQKLQEVEISLFAIDEAHCISQWGHAFRPEYRQLSLLKKHFPKASVIALTATATHAVQKDISEQLALENPHVVRASFDRPNLTFNIRAKTHGTQQLQKFLEKHQNASGVIYGATRKTVDETFAELTALGFKVGKYHAGMSDKERAQAQHAFIHGDLLLMVATVAFGMGIHKPDIRFIVHLDMPRSIEQYYQEVGRAGRDGLPAECLMLFSGQEMVIYNLFLSDLTDPLIKRETKAKTEKIYALCHSTICRRKELLRYFGETYPQANCNGCDNCLNNTELVDETVAAQKILSCVYRLQQKFGIKHVIEVLRGAKTKSVLDKGHDQLSTYALMHDYTEEDLRYHIDNLISKGFLERTGDEFPVLRWTPTSLEAAKGNTKIYLRKKITEIATRKTSSDFNYDKELFGLLSTLRRKWAQETHVPAYVVFGDRSLIEMSTTYPLSKKEMLEINGFGPVKWEKYGESFLQVIKEYCEGKGITSSLSPKSIPKLPVKQEKPLSSKETLLFFQQGHQPAAIASLRSLTERTVIHHLVEQILLGAELEIHRLVAEEKKAAIEAAIEKIGCDKLTPIKNALPDTFTFEEINIVVALYKRKLERKEA